VAFLSPADLYIGDNLAARIIVSLNIHPTPYLVNIGFRAKTDRNGGFCRKLQIGSLESMSRTVYAFTRRLVTYGRSSNVSAFS